MLSVRSLTRAFDGQPVLRGISLEVPNHEIVCLLGPSGCGKTTALRIIVGLETADSGEVWWDGERIDAIPVHERGFGLMFQDFALFPHLNVRDNIRFGMRMRHLPQGEQERRMRDVLELVGLQGFEKRDVSALSGGEKQRVALARSLAPNPRLLLLDEPLGSLDAALRERLVMELRAIIKSAGLTAIYVTHDQREAFAVADRIAVMNAGRIEQIDSPAVLYQSPKTAFVARFLGLNNLLDRAAALNLLPSHTILTGDLVLLHPDGLRLVDSADDSTIAARVVESTFSGDVYRITVQTDTGIRLTFNQRTRDFPDVSGNQVWVQIDPASVISVER
ncbi:MAG: ABC transporter ATP-binding protein [Anaerolineae bacterium]